MYRYAIIHMIILLYFSSEIKDLCLKAPLSVQQYISGMNGIRETEMNEIFPCHQEVCCITWKF